MGLYDREYVRQREWGGPQRRLQDYSAITILIVANVAIWGIDALSQLFFNTAWLNLSLAAYPSDLWQPWMWWRFITAGFAHDPSGPIHILFNMLLLFFFGREIEQMRGKNEFLRFYFAALLISSVAGCLWTYSLEGAVPVAHLGASGGVLAVMVVFALNFPFRTVLLYFIIPVPIWLIVTVAILIDLLYIADQDGIGHAAHLSGALFGFIYYQAKLNLGDWTANLPSFSRGPSLPRGWKVHSPPSDADLDDEVDRVLRKMREQGESSLTKQDRQVLEEASRRYQRRRKM